MTLKLESHLQDDGAVLVCKGQLVGGEETAVLRNAVTRLFQQRNHVTLDLSGIEYINSGGLSTLVGLYSTARTSGGNIKYINLSVATDFNRGKSKAA
jgi:anti-anti-sigma factor